MNDLQARKSRYQVLADLGDRLKQDAIAIEKAGIKHGGIRLQIAKLRREIYQHLNTQKFAIKKREHANDQSACA